MHASPLFKSIGNGFTLLSAPPTRNTPSRPNLWIYLLDIVYIVLSLVVKILTRMKLGVHGDLVPSDQYGQLKSPSAIIIENKML